MLGMLDTRLLWKRSDVVMLQKGVLWQKYLRLKR